MGYVRLCKLSAIHSSSDALSLDAGRCSGSSQSLERSSLAILPHGLAYRVEGFMES